MAAAALMIPAAVMMMMILLLNPSGCDAQLTSFKPLVNDTSRIGKYIVGEQDIESEFLMESHIGRILASSNNHQTTTTTDANKASVGNCGRPPRYDSCLGNKKNNPRPDNCGTYNRENPC